MTKRKSENQQERLPNRRKDGRPIPSSRPERFHAPDRNSTPLTNRELSFLAFNERVLALVSDPAVPLLERLRFLCISSSNLDEFFEVRVAGIKQKILGGIEAAGIDGLSPQQELNAINVQAHEFVKQQYSLLNDKLLPMLAEEQVLFFRRQTWDSALTDWVRRYFENEIAPVLSRTGTAFFTACHTRA